MSDSSVLSPDAPISESISPHLPIGSIVRAVCEAANGGPDLLYEVMIKVSLMVEATAPTYGLSIWAAQQWGATFPYGTLLINVLGSFAIGVVMVLLTTRLAVSDVWRLLIVTGLLGGFTTFSTFSYETYGLLVSGSWLEAGLNIVGSVGLGLIGVFLGAGLARLSP